MTRTVVQIWRPETGITDIAGDPNSFSASELVGVRMVWRDWREQLKGTEQLREFTEKLSREWAIETGAIEGLYDIDRGVTATLIDNGFHAELISHGSVDRPREFVLKLLRDQKDALEGVFSFVKHGRLISVSYIKELHAALLRSQTTTEAIDSTGRSLETSLIKGDFKKLPNFPVRDGTEYQYCPPEQVASEMDRLIELHRSHVAAGVQSDVQAAWLHHRFSQIHPFQDGNGRVARAIATAVLVKGGLFPLIVTRQTRSTYIDALARADGGDLSPLIAFIAKTQRVQFAKALEVSQAASSRGVGVGSALEALERAATKMSQIEGDRLAQAVLRANILQENVESRLSQLEPEINGKLSILDAQARSSISRSWLAQQDRTLTNVDASLAWATLSVAWRNKYASLTFAIFGVGNPFSGALYCRPSFELSNLHGDDDRSKLVPIAEEDFLFFNSDDREALLRRFEPWREEAIRVAILELGRNL